MKAECNFANADQGSFRYVCGNGLDSLVERSPLMTPPPGWSGPYNGTGILRYTNCPFESSSSHFIESWLRFGKVFMNFFLSMETLNEANTFVF